MTRVLAIPGSLRRESHNRRLLAAAADLAPGGVAVVLWDGLRDLPPYDEDADVEPAPAAVARLRAAISGADALLIATPEYNASIPGVLKNAVDWASRPFPASVLRNRPVAVAGAATGSYGAVWAQGDLRKALATAGARVVDAALSVPRAAEAFDAEGRLVDPAARAGLRDLVAALVAEAGPARAAA